MKNSFTTLLAATLSAAICCGDLYAQDKHGSQTKLGDGYDFSTFTINGLVIGGPDRYTEQDIIDAFGQPDTVEFDFMGYTYTYYMRVSSVKKNYVPIGDLSATITMPNKEDVILSAYIYDETSVVNDYIRVGDPITKVFDMGGSFHQTDYGGGKGAIFWRPSGWGNADWIVCPKFTYDANGIITSIGCWQY